MLTAALPASAHEVHARVTKGPAAFRLEFFFADGSPAADFAVTAEYDEGGTQDVGRTDDRGGIVFRPAQRSACVLAARQAGHGQNLSIPLADVAAVYDALHATIADATVGRAATSQPSSQPRTSSNRHDFAWGSSQRSPVPFPWAEAAASVLFVGVLAGVTLVLMRLADRRTTPVPSVDCDALVQEIAELREEIRRLKRERSEP